jgi:predicted nucleotidyltransferase
MFRIRAGVEVRAHLRRLVRHIRVDDLWIRHLDDVKEYAASILGRKTDIMTRDSLHKILRRTIEATAVRVF